MTLGKSFPLSTSATSTNLEAFWTALKETQLALGTHAALRQVNCYHLCLAVNSKCPKTQFLFPNLGQYCFLTDSQGDTAAGVGVGRPLGEHQPAGPSWGRSARPHGSPPEQRWEQLCICVAPPASIHLQIRLPPPPAQGGQGSRHHRQQMQQGNRRQPKLNCRLRCQKQRFQPQAGWVPATASRSLKAGKRTNFASPSVSRRLYA